jgi:signal transduction histidine kinase
VRNEKNKKKVMRPAITPEFQNENLTREVEEKFNNSGNLYQAIENADGIPYQLVFGKRIGEGYFLNIGDGIRELFGIASGEFTEELFQRAILEIHPFFPATPHSPAELREKIISGDIRKSKSEIMIATTDGEKRWIKDCYVAIIDDKTGRVTGLQGIFFDITGQKQLLTQLEAAREKATESDRLKTAFLNNLTHEIRTPLNAIVGFSTLLNEPGQLLDNRLEFQDIITHSSDHLLEIVDDVVEISKIEAKVIQLIKKEANINEMLQRVYNRFRPDAEERKIILRYDAPVGQQELIITTDGYKLFQTLSNLVGNAVKFTVEGKVNFGYTIKEKHVEFYVSDTGIGIGVEHHLNVFKPFYQCESSSTKRYEGTGLGLSIAKAYVELLGGEIWFNSKPGEGSVFSFNIPLGNG